MASIRLVRASLVCTLVLGCLTALLDIVWRPVYEAASVDVILSPPELRNRELIDVVYRTHRHNASGRYRFPLWVLGGMTMAASFVGLLGSRLRLGGGGLLESEHLDRNSPASDRTDRGPSL